jgi:hypothetical protein
LYGRCLVLSRKTWIGFWQLVGRTPPLCAFVYESGTRDEPHIRPSDWRLNWFRRFLSWTLQAGGNETGVPPEKNLDSKSDSISARHAEFAHKRGQEPNGKSIA